MTITPKFSMPLKALTSHDVPHDRHPRISTPLKWSLGVRERFATRVFSYELLMVTRCDEEHAAFGGKTGREARARPAPPLGGGRRSACHVACRVAGTSFLRSRDRGAPPCAMRRPGCSRICSETTHLQRATRENGSGFRPVSPRKSPLLAGAASEREGCWEQRRRNARRS